MVYLRVVRKLKGPRVNPLGILEEGELAQDARGFSRPDSLTASPHM